MLGARRTSTMNIQSLGVMVISLTFNGEILKLVVLLQSSGRLLRCLGLFGLLCGRCGLGLVASHGDEVCVGFEQTTENILSSSVWKNLTDTQKEFRESP